MEKRYVTINLRFYPSQVATLNAAHKRFVETTGYNVSREEWMRKAVLANTPAQPGAYGFVADDDTASGPYLPGLEPAATLENTRNRTPGQLAAPALTAALVKKMSIKRRASNGSRLAPKAKRRDTKKSAASRRAGKKA